MIEVDYPLNCESAEAAYSLWSYLRVEDPLEEVYCIMAMGCSRTEVAQTAGRLFGLKITSLIVCTGANSKVTESWDKTEAQVYQEVLLNNGVPERNILLEQKAKSFGDNINYTQELLEKYGGKPDVILGVTIDYAARRWKASIQKQWDTVRALVVPAGIKFESYLESPAKFNKLVPGLRFEFAKILDYPQKNFMAPQDLDDPKFRKAFLADGDLTEMKSAQKVAA